MVLLAILNHTQFELSSHELRRDGPSYTVDTLRELRREMGEDVELFLIIGADNALEIPTWHCPDGVLELANVLVVRRPGSDLSGVDGAVTTHLQMVESPEIEISSTDIRARVREGRSIRYHVPFEVENYINNQGLYRLPDST